MIDLASDGVEGGADDDAASGVIDLASGIWAMPVIREHPDWWCYLPLDGFGSHITPAALEIFAKYKILVTKEEGDTSQASQAYDQHVAKADKRWSRELLDGYRFHSKGPVDQYTLVLIVNQALNKVTRKTWSDSFRKVNANH